MQIQLAEASIYGTMILITMHAQSTKHSCVAHSKVLKKAGNTARISTLMVLLRQQMQLSGRPEDFGV